MSQKYHMSLHQISSSDVVIIFFIYARGKQSRISPCENPRDERRETLNKKLERLFSVACLTHPRVETVATEKRGERNRTRLMYPAKGTRCDDEWGGGKPGGDGVEKGNTMSEVE